MAEDKATPTTPKKAAHRSPNYPAFDLTVALEKSRVIYDEDKRTATTPEVIAGHLGYKHTDGPGGRALSCLRQYGLLEESAGKLKVSDLAFNLLHLPNEDRNKAVLLKQAALRPNLYRALHEDYPDGIPSDPTLRSNLLNRGFNPDSIEGVIADFKTTLDIAKVYNGLHNEGEDESIMQTPLPATPETPNVHKPSIPLADTPTTKAYALAFEGEGKAVLTLTGSYTTEDLDDLKAYLDTSLKILKRSVKKENVQ